MKKKYLAGGVAALALALTVSACGSSDSDSDSSSSSAKEIRVWLNGADTPQDARDYLKTTFEKEHPGTKLVIEEQVWDGLVAKLTTSLSSESETPDVVEVGNTQAPTFTTAGASPT